MDCKEFAVVAFWDLGKHGDEVLYCSHFFIVPSPRKRIIKEVMETKLEQVLFVSESTKEVFFFWEGYSQVDSIEIDRQKQLHISFLELTRSREEIEEIGEIRHIHTHCKQTYPINEDSPLKAYLSHNHELDLEKQN